MSFICPGSKNNIQFILTTNYKRNETPNSLKRRNLLTLSKVYIFIFYRFIAWGLSPQSHFILSDNMSQDGGYAIAEGSQVQLPGGIYGCRFSKYHCS